MVFKDSSSPDHSVILYLLSATLAVSGLQDRVLVAGAHGGAGCLPAAYRHHMEQISPYSHGGAHGAAVDGS